MVGNALFIVVYYWADLQSVQGFRCYNDIAPNAKRQRVRHECLYSLYAWLSQLLSLADDVNLDKFSAIGKTA